jgi:hypothetical protein
MHDQAAAEDELEPLFWGQFIFGLCKANMFLAENLVCCGKCVTWIYFQVAKFMIWLRRQGCGVVNPILKFATFYALAIWRRITENHRYEKTKVVMERIKIRNK